MPEGRAEIVISGTSHVPWPGEMIIMPAGEPHALKAMEPFRMMLVMIRGWAPVAYPARHQLFGAS